MCCSVVKLTPDCELARGQASLRPRCVEAEVSSSDLGVFMGHSFPKWEIKRRQPRSDGNG